MTFDNRKKFLESQEQYRNTLKTIADSEMINEILNSRPRPKFEDNILCESKFGEPRYYEEQVDGTYLVYGPSHFVRTATGQFDFEGGPNISAGDPFIINKEKIGIIQNVVYFDEGPEDLTCCKITLK